ncbi:hypothetical protein DW094_06765 [Ruminococcaceae bacterium AM07-15]|nr:hypothetical protein DW094_06765 [Ruminococcaceae bacterium AM07-15]
MAPRKGSRSSKTDHVLNLLSHPSTPEPQQPAKQAANEKAPEETLPTSAPEGNTVPHHDAPPREERRLTPPVLEVARANNEALEETIREALESALALDESEDASTEEPTAVEEPAPVEESAPTEAPAPVEESASAEEPAPTEAPALVEESASAEEPAPIEEPVPIEESVPAEEPAPVEEPAPAEEPISNKLPTPEEAALIKPEEILPDESRFVNVMLPLVEEKLLKYVRMFHLCECPRCLADVKALALSHLPPKYVVLEGSTYTPMMSFYQAKFDSDVTAQVIHACKQVMEAPRHGKIPGLEQETH